MKNRIELALASRALGRVALHLACLFQHGKIRFHVAGIVRELKGGAR